MKYRFSLLLLIACVLIHVSSYGEWHTDTQSIMGTEVSVSIWHSDPKFAVPIIAEVMAEMRRIDQTYSPYIESSDLANLNRMAFKQAVHVSDEFYWLIKRSLEFGELSNGAFDITFASVGWYYDYREEKRPDDKQIESLLPAVNYQYVVLAENPKAVKFEHENVRIDLGGIAKGYAIDQASKIFAKHKVVSATVSAGGDSRVVGDNQGRPWVVGIKNPRKQHDDDKESVIRLPLENTAISTSGDYERYFIDESGQRVHHILNPRTGKSAQEVVSVTVLGDRGVDTDALSTTVFVLGVEKGLALINRIPGFDCIIIDRFGKVHYSDDLLPG